MTDLAIVDTIWSNPRIHTAYAAALRKTFQADEAPSPSAKLLASLPVLFCEGYGGLPEQAAPFVAVWNLLRHAARLLDDVEDGHMALRPDEALELNRSTGLLVTAGYILGALEAQGIPGSTADDIREQFFTTLLQVCGGQHQDLMSAPPSLERSWQIAVDKTAAALGLVCWVGCRLVCDEPAELERCQQFGFHLGLLDQIRDDCLDLTGMEDLYRASQNSLPLAYALSVLPTAQKERLMGLVKSGDRSQENERLARQIIMESGAAVYLAAQFTLYRTRCLQLLGEMSLNPAARERLRGLLDHFQLA